jgi:cysteine synthase A
VGTGGLGDAEWRSFSARVPGVVEGLSKLLDPARMPVLVELDIADELAIATPQALIRRCFPVGPSSGLNYAAAVEAAQSLGSGSQVVTVFPDRMERYFSTYLIRRTTPSAAAGSTGPGLSMAASPPQKR